ncbi:MAG: DUF348 domain-containing protein [Anaerolineae bacterium]|jgi:resuscitation-promoting factor RpfB|nr:DUF348 domain-containing protein [Anaerolineae bacterium]MBT7070381.1 DUF348 domain-containing protein [Anaerolineae bacterium]MBT7324423.1 DUF348 domain-containing protein [Anaerolineae bacterium]
MKYTLWLALIFILAACQPQAPLETVDILDGENYISQSAESRIPAQILESAGITLNPIDRLLVNGQFFDVNTPLDCDVCTLQIRRAVTMTLITPDGEQTLISAALSIGDALNEYGIQLHTTDFLDPPAGTPAADQLKITYRPSRPLAILVDGQIIPIRSSAETVGGALLEGGIPLIGLDASQPSEFDQLPIDGQIRVIRIVEKIELEQTEIPFEVEYIPSNEIAVDEEEILEPGQTGLIVSRTRVRYEDGIEVSRISEEERTVRKPSTQVVGYGTQYVLKTAIVDGREIEYWRAIQVYATSYSPCNSGADRCYPNTASGIPVQQGVIAVIRSWYNAMQGQAVYVPGYGQATIEDIGAGFPDKDWIDLGYTDEAYPGLSRWVTLYFLPPVPANALWVLE